MVSKNRSSADSAAPCIMCKSNVTNADKTAVQCDLCKGWVHSKCSAIPSIMAEYFNSAEYKKSPMKHAMFCVACDPIRRKLLDSLPALDKKLDDHKAEFDGKLVKVVADFEAMLDAKLASIVQTKAVGPVSLAGGQMMGTGGKMATMVAGRRPWTDGVMDFSMLVKDEMEIEKKKNNAVLFGLPEEDDVDDLSAVRQLVIDCANECNILKPESIKHVFRDGPRLEDKPKFLKVECCDFRAKKEFIFLINKRFKSQHLRARPDLSYLQRERARELRREFHQLSDKEDFYIDYAACAIRRKNVFGEKPNSKVSSI